MNNFVKLGKKLSDDFVNTGIDLTKGLQKVALSESLNQQQLRRVAETANVETYLKLAATAEDNYIVFPVADVNKALENLDKVANYVPNNSSSLFDNQWEDIVTGIVASGSKGHIEEQDILKKVASDNQYKDMPYHEVSRKSTHFMNTISEANELEAEMYYKYASLLNLSKQALAQEHEFGELKQVIKTASCEKEDYSDIVLESLSTDLERFYPLASFEDITTSKEINTDSQLYKKAHDLSLAINEIDQKYKDVTMQAKELLDINEVTPYSFYIKEALRKVDTRKIPVKKALKWLGIGGLGGVVTMKAVKDEKKHYENLNR